MSRQPPSIETLVRQAFGLLIEIRAHREARWQLTLAVAFLQGLLRKACAEATPVLISVQAVRIGKP